MGDTTKQMKYGQAPNKVVLTGDKKEMESAEHIIEFPGGAISVTRVPNLTTRKDEYWAHISINSNDGFVEGSTREHKRGRVIDSRIDYVHPTEPNVIPISRDDLVDHIAIRIETE